jgi:hypothetical protein
VYTPDNSPVTRSKDERIVILPILMGVSWGFAAAGIHYLLLRRTIERRRQAGAKPSAMMAQVSSLWRMGAVGGFLLVGLFWETVRMDAAVVAYAVSFLGVIMIYGIRLSLETARVEALHKESGR